MYSLRRDSCWSTRDKEAREREAHWVVQNKLKPLHDKGGMTYFSTFTFGARGPTHWLHEQLNKAIVSYMLNLAREAQAVITPFVGYWCEAEDYRKHTHWHAAIHCNKAIPIKILTDCWKYEANRLGISEHKIYDFSLGGLSYIWGQHQYGSELYKRPFTPPKHKKSGRVRKPKRHKRKTKTEQVIDELLEDVRKLGIKR